MKVKHNILHPKSNITPHLTGERKIILLRPKNILFTLATLFAGVFVVGEVSALTYSNEMDVQFTFNPTVSINVTGDLSIAELAPGNALDSNIITVTAGSNETNGYTLYSTVGSSTNNYTDLRLSSSNTTNVFTNLSSNKTSLDDFDSNTWGYSYCLTTNDCSNTTSTNPYWVCGSTGSTTTGYNGLPIYNASDNTTGVKLADTSTAAETELKFKIGAKAASTQASGTYTNTVSFIGVAKVVTTDYTLNYNVNAGPDTVTGAPANISDGTTNTSAITLSNTTPVRDGYTFKGWCTANTSETACSDGALYGPGRIYIFANPGTTATVNLYAIWQPPKTYMQNIAPARLAALMPNVGDTTTLYDNRDEQDYTVAKLADGKYWMTKNLNLAGGTALSSDDTDFESTYTLPTTNGWTVSDGKLVLPASNPSGFITDNYAYVANSNSETCTANTPCYSYYSWDAATLGSGRNISADNANAPYSICPSGWRLPTTYNGSSTVAESADFHALIISLGGSGSIQTYNSYTVPTSATIFGLMGPGTTPNFSLAGGYEGGSFYRGGSRGYYWSATSDSSDMDAHYLYFTSGVIILADSDYRRGAIPFAAFLAVNLSF